MIKKFLVSLAIFIIVLNSIIPSAFALEMSSADLVKIGEVDYHLKYFNSDKGIPTYVIASVVGYNHNNKFYPAYCMNSGLPGAENNQYTVNISEMINNDAVWRVVTHGYPYVSAEDMGLTNDFDAYMVTKMAIYCVLGQSDINKFSYDENDNIAHRMYDLLKFLVTIGGQEELGSMQTGTLSVNKLGDLVETDNSYYQDYSVISRVNMENFEVNVSNFPEGTQLVNTANNPQTVYNSGENFRILLPKSGFNDNINGNIDIISHVENYPIFYGEGPEGYQNYAVTYDKYGEEKKTENLQISVNTGSLKVLKVDKDIKIPLENVEFSLKNNNSGEERKLVTDKNGEAIFSKLKPGKYTLIETKTGDSYILDSTKFDINIEYNKQSEITIGNSIKTGQIKVIKKDTDTKQPLKGVTFEILNGDTKEVIENLVTNENGEALSSKLRVDKSYILKEKWENEQYKENNKEYPFTVSENKVIEIEVENEKQKGNLKIVKFDKDNNNIKLQNVKFELYDENMNLLETLETNENGECVSKDYPSVDTKYYLKEKETLEEYRANEEIIEVELITDKTVELEIENEKKKGSFKIIKTNLDEKEVKLSKVKFELYDEEMNLLETLETDENGECISKNYPSINTKYYLKEIEAPEEYNIMEKMLEIELLTDETIEINIENEKKKGNIKLQKLDSADSNVKLQGVKFELYDENMNLLEILETDKEGVAVSKKYPSVNKKYYLRETKTVDGYYFNGELVEITLKDNDVLELKIANKKMPIPIKEIVTNEVKTNTVHQKETVKKEILRVVEKNNEREVIVKKLPKTGR